MVVLNEFEIRESITNKEKFKALITNVVNIINEKNEKMRSMSSDFNSQVGYYITTILVIYIIYSQSKTAEKSQPLIIFPKK